MTEQTEKAELIPTAKWIRAFLGNEAVADSRNAQILRAHGQIPIYYFPAADVKKEYLEQVASDAKVASQGEGPWPKPPARKKVYTIEVNGKTAVNAAWQVEESTETPELAEYFAFVWSAMDAWYEEDEQVRFHPHDPYHLIDVRASSRHVNVILQDQVVAETKRPVLLFEAGLPERYYIPKADVRMDLLVLSENTAHCAYKGISSYYSALTNDTLIEDIAWTYPYPNYLYAPIQDLVAFPQEGVDEFLVDGQQITKA